MHMSVSVSLCVCVCVCVCTCVDLYVCITHSIDIHDVYRSDDESILYVEIPKRSEGCRQAEVGKECMLAWTNSPSKMLYCLATILSLETS